MGSAIQPQTGSRLRKPLSSTGSPDRRFDRWSSRSALAPWHRRVDRLVTGRCRYALPRAIVAPCHTGHLVIQSRPKPRGGSIASRSAMPSSAIARKASVMALSPGVGRGMAPAPNRYVTKPRRPGRAGTSHRSSSSPMRYEPSCWLMPRQRPCAACGGAVSTAIRWPACCPVFRRP